MDDQITEEFLAIFPGGPQAVAKLSDRKILELINQRGNVAKIKRCMSGSTVLVALVDPRHENLWVASLGDCLAGEFRKIVSLPLALATLSLRSLIRVFVDDRPYSSRRINIPRHHGNGFKRISQWKESTRKVTHATRASGRARCYLQRPRTRLFGRYPR